jgi:predicted Zn-dependent peptidase
MIDRTVAPEFSAPRYFPLPKPNIVELKNGCRIFQLKTGNQPVLKIDFIFRSGIRFEAYSGIAYFAAKMLTEGTKNYKSEDISELLEKYGVFVDIHPGFDFIHLSLHLPTKNLEKVVKLFTEILVYPTFPESELKLLKQIQSRQLKVNEQKNSFMASRMFRQRLFKDSPYGHIMDEAAIHAIDRSAISTYFANSMLGKFDIFLTGDFEEDTLDCIVEPLQNHLTQIHPFNDLRSSKESYFEQYLEKDASVQSSIVMGRKCINRKDKYYPKLLLLNEIFGGYFGSRLMQNLREDKGFTYGVHSHIASFRDEAYFLISTEVKKEFRAEAIEEIHREIEILKTKKINHEEFTEAKNHLKGSILNTITNPFAIMDKLQNIYLYDLGLSFYAELFEQIDQATPADMQFLADELLFDNELSRVIVG